MGVLATRERACERIEELSGRGYDVVTLWREASDLLKPVVPHDLAPCWFTLDPASLLMTSHFSDELPVFPPGFLEMEYRGEGVNHLFDIVRSERGASTLLEATGGDLRSCERWHALMEMGADQELITALRTDSGEAWGSLGLYRAPDSPQFTDEEIAFLKTVGPHLAKGARVGLLVGEATDPEWPDSPGMVVVSDQGELESATEGVGILMRDLPDGDWDAGTLPHSVRAVAGQALRNAEGRNAPGEIALTRVLSKSGVWMVLHGASLVGSGPGRVAVIVEPAHPARIVPLLMSAYGLSKREQHVTQLVLQGESTAQIAERLVVSPHTVQDHLKRVFEKTGVNSRRDLVGKVFFSHYEPRFRDNETRTAEDRPTRGGPHFQAT